MSLWAIPQNYMGVATSLTYWITFEDIQVGVHAAQSIGEVYALLIHTMICLILLNTHYFQRYTRKSIEIKIAAILSMKRILSLILKVLQRVRMLVLISI